MHERDIETDPNSYKLRALECLIVIGGTIAVLDSLVATHQPARALLTFVSGLSTLTIAIYLRRTSNLQVAMYAVSIATAAVFLGDFLLFCDPYYFAIGFSVPIGAALFMKTRDACYVLVSYGVLGLLIGSLVHFQLVRPVYESGQVIEQTVAALAIIVALAGPVMWKERLLLNAMEQERAHRQQVFELSRLESLGSVCGGIAHDFNNLLTVIGIHGESIRDPGERESFLEAQRQAADLTAGLLTFARKRTFRESHVSLADFLTDSRPLIERLVPANIHCRWNVDCGDAIVRVDPSQLQQVLINLVTNSIHSMPDGGSVSIEATSDAKAQVNNDGKGFARLTISDTGSGMDSETKSRATEPFFTTKPRGIGTGLGLATVQGAVKNAGGHIEIQSELGKGTEISIALPLQGAEPSILHDSNFDGTPEFQRRSSRRVILVEDREALAKALALMLTKAGHTVDTFGDAESAWRAFEAGANPDAIVSDVVLPGQSGVDLVKKVMSKQPFIKVVLMSGHQKTELSIVSENPGSIRFLPKPFKTEELLNAISELTCRSHEAA